MSDDDKDCKLGDSVKAIWLFFRNSKEALLAIVVLALFWAYPLVIGFIDPSARSVDFSFVHMLIMRILGLTGSVLAVWALIHAAFPTLEAYTSKDDPRVKKQFVDDFQALTPTARLLTFLGVFIFLIWILNK